MTGPFRNKALRRLWEDDLTRGVNPDHLPRLRTILSMLNAAESLADLNVPGFYLHRLRGSPVRHSLRVSANWRVTFEWREGVAHAIDYEDYH